ncbi:PBSX family phage terminase large subunit [Gracilimonas sp.]|uniref:PBSX family phage terminase large subunit n=1 Tax=Gracilimonas sp. TaxID=1974203 RepID=UPI0028720D94|nr:PBSX family phage terminase large subunit [Gracilimonas sp.]
MKNGKAPTPNPYLKDFWLKEARFRILYGGRDSSKSWDAATRAAWIAQKIKVRFLCTRMYQNKIEESVYTLIKKQIRRFGFTGYKIMHNKIIHEGTGSEFLFYGLARNIDEIKSLEGVDIAWLEEAHALTEEMWELLEPTVRKEHSEFWIVMNPMLRTDFAYQRFIENPPKGAVVRKINYDENPFLTETSKTTIERIKEEDFESFEHIYLGFPKKDDDDAIIKRSWVEACIDAHLKLDVEISGEKVIGYDPADAGEDTNAISYKYGNLVTDTLQWYGKEDELFKSSQKVYNEAKAGYHVTYDSIGVGAGVGSNFIQLGDKIDYSAFNAGASVKNPDREYKPGIINKDHFSNLKAQTWFNVADRMMATYNAIQKGQHIDKSEILSISSECSNLEALITELSTPKKDYDGKGRVKVESKKDLAKRGIKSPNLADSFVMCFAPKNPQPGFA